LPASVSVPGLPSIYESRERIHELGHLFYRCHLQLQQKILYANAGHNIRCLSTEYKCTYLHPIGPS
jgi:hypothetical protein